MGAVKTPARLGQYDFDVAQLLILVFKRLEIIGESNNRAIISVGVQCQLGARFMR